MGQFSVKIYGATGSALSAKQQNSTSQRGAATTPSLVAMALMFWMAGPVPTTCLLVARRMLFLAVSAMWLTVAKTLMETILMFWF